MDFSYIHLCYKVYNGLSTLSTGLITIIIYTYMFLEANHCFVAVLFKKGNEKPKHETWKCSSGADALSKIRRMMQTGHTVLNHAIAETQSGAINYLLMKVGKFRISGSTIPEQLCQQTLQRQAVEILAYPQVGPMEDSCVSE